MSSRRPRVRPVLVAAVIIGVLAGCTTSPPQASPSTPATSETPSASPEPAPTRPVTGELVLSTEGFAATAIGSAPATDAATSMATYDPSGCDGYGLWTTDPSYATTAFFGPDIAFGAGGAGVVERIELYSDVISTNAGIRLRGSTREDVEAAYPDATMSWQNLTDVYLVEGDAGDLLIEIAAGDPEYWNSTGAEVGKVKFIRAVTHDTQPYSIAGSGNVVGVCGS